MAKERIKQSAKESVKKSTRLRTLKIILLITSLFLINLYIILGIMYKGQSFTVSLDSEQGLQSNLTIYEKLEEKTERTYLKCEDIDFFTDISVDWIPDDINDRAEGSHCGNNYIAYTFYAENQGQETINYWAAIEIEDVIKNVDDAIRVMVYRNGERVVYAKPASNGGTERGTTPFKDESTVMLEQIQNFKVGDIDKYTIVIFIEGDDPQCTDAIIGGEIGMYMRLTEEHIPQEESENN